MFKCSAYEILSDEKKRAMYDQTGSTEEDPYAGFDPGDMFSGMGNINM